MYTMVLSAAGHKAPDFRELTFSETRGSNLLLHTPLLECMNSYIGAYSSP